MNRGRLRPTGRSDPTRGVVGPIGPCSLTGTDGLTRAVPIVERARGERRLAIGVAGALVRGGLTSISLSAGRVVGSKTQEASAVRVRRARRRNALAERIAALTHVTGTAVGVLGASVVAVTAGVGAGHAAVALRLRRAVRVDTARTVQDASVGGGKATLRGSRQPRGTSMDGRAMPDLPVAGNESRFGRVEDDRDGARAPTFGRLRCRGFGVVEARVRLGAGRFVLRFGRGAASDECERERHRDRGYARAANDGQTNGGEGAEAHGASEPISRSRTGALRKTRRSVRELRYILEALETSRARARTVTDPRRYACRSCALSTRRGPRPGWSLS